MRRQVILVISIVIAMLSLSLLGSALGGAGSSPERAIIAHVPAADPDRTGLQAREAAPHRRGPAIAKRRALHPHRSGFVRTPKGGRLEVVPDPLTPPSAAAPAAPGQSPNATAPATPTVPGGTPEAPGPIGRAPEPSVPAPPTPAPTEPTPPTPSPPAPVPPVPTPQPPVVDPSEPVPPRTQDPDPVLPPFFAGELIADFDGIQAAPGAVNEVSDPLGSGETVFQLTVDEGDVAPLTPTDNPRAQLLSPSLVRPGDEFWLATKFLLPADFPANVPGWLSLIEIYGPPFAGPSPWRIGIAGDHFHWERNGTYDWDNPWQMPLVRGRWVELLLHERFAGDGWVEMWIDGQRVTFFPGTSRSTEHLEMATVDSSNNGSVNHAKLMNYRQAGMFETVTVFFGALRLGETRASVAG